MSYWCGGFPFHLMRTQSTPHPRSLVILMIVVLLSPSITLLIPNYDNATVLEKVTSSKQSGDVEHSVEWIIEAPHRSNLQTGTDFAFTATEAMGNDTIVAGYYSVNSTLGDWNITDNGTGDESGFVGVLNQTGSWQWVATTGSSGHASINTVAPDGQGGVFVGGYVLGTVDFGSHRTYNSGNYNPFVAHLNSTGHWQWVNRATNNDWGRVNDIAVMSDGGVAVAGTFAGWMHFNGGQNIDSQSSTSDGFIARINASGGGEWWSQIGRMEAYHDTVNAIIVDELDNIYVTGVCMEWISYRRSDLDASGDIQPNVNHCSYWNSWDGEAFAMRLSSSGSFQWFQEVRVDQVGRWGVDLDFLSNGNLLIMITGYDSGHSDRQGRGIEFTEITRAGELEPNADWCCSGDHSAMFNPIAMVITDNDAIYVLGENNNMVGQTFDGIQVESEFGGDDLFLGKYDWNTKAWRFIEQFGSTGDDEPTGMILSGDSILITGVTRGNVSMGAFSEVSHDVQAGFMWSSLRADADDDGILDKNDQCPSTPHGEVSDNFGCSETQSDGDDDGILNADDDCPNTSAGVSVNATGCAPSQIDTDGDGIYDSDDDCPVTPIGATVDENGCDVNGGDLIDLDTDGDGVRDSVDECGDTAQGWVVDSTGCVMNTQNAEESHSAVWSICVGILVIAVATMFLLGWKSRAGRLEQLQMERNQRRVDRIIRDSEEKWQDTQLQTESMIQTTTNPVQTPTRDPSRAAEAKSLKQAGVPGLLIDAYVEKKCSLQEMLEIWGLVGKEAEIPADEVLFFSTLIDTCGDETCIPEKYKGCSLKHLEQEIRGLAQLHPGMIPIVFAPSSERIGREDIDFLLDIGRDDRHPNLLYAVLDPNRTEWSVENAQDLVLKFDEHPDAILEVLNGANQDAVAYKYGLLQGVD